MRKRVTQADVARKAGVSQTAVSQILGGSENAGNFRESTRNKVMRAAKELGYVPSYMARGLRTNRTMTLGVVVSFILDELAMRITRGIQEVAVEHGYSILIGDTDQDSRLESQILHHFQQYHVDGLIFVDSWADPQMYLDNPTCPPVVFAQLRQPIYQQNCVDSDNFKGGYECTEHLIQLGYRRIAHISGPDNWAPSIDRKKGYWQALHDHNIDASDTLIETGDWEINGGYEATLLLLDRHPDIDAIFVANDLMAAGGIQALASRGLRVPDDVGIVSYDDRQITEALVPPLTSYAIPLDQIGQQAAHMLIDQLIHVGENRVMSRTIEGGLVVRQSCGAGLRGSQQPQQGEKPENRSIRP